MITHETGKVLDYHVMSKECEGCRKWEGKDKTSQEDIEWKQKHECTADFDGSSCSMEHQVEKTDCIGHIQKRMGTALRV